MLNLPNAQEEKRRVSQKVREVLVQLGYSDLKVEIKWMTHATNCMGRAYASWKDLQPFQLILKFSEPLWPYASFEQRNTTIIHEVSHIIADLEARQKGLSSPKHGIAWQKVMHRAGISDPQRYHSVFIPNKGTPTYCKCTQPHILSNKQIAKMKKGAKYLCKACRTELTLVPQKSF